MANFYDEKQEKQVAAAPQSTQQSAGNQTVENAGGQAVQKPSQATDISASAYQQALESLQNASKELPQYSGSYDTQVNDAYQQIVNRDKFRYDLDADMLYQQMRDEYINLGQLAMRDTMGQAAALTGGYGSSYGQGVGQQQYNAYLKTLNEQIPDLYGMALNQYTQEGEDLYRQYSMAQNMAGDEYGKYQDAMNRYWQNLDYLQGQANTEYAKQQDAYGQLQALISTTGFKPSAEQLAAAGMSQQEADALRLLWAQADPERAYRAGQLTDDEYYVVTGKKKGGSSGGGGYYYGGPGSGGSNPFDENEGEDLLRVVSDTLKDRGVDATIKFINSSNNLTPSQKFQAVGWAEDYKR